MGRQNPDGRQKVYRLLLVENDTHRSIRTVLFTKSRFVYFAVTAVVVFVLLIYCIVAFTPLKLTIPGYPDANFKRTALANAIKVDSLQSSVTRWHLYAENLSRVLAGESTLSLDSLIDGNSLRYLSDKSAEELARRDSVLRETVQKEEKFGVSAGNAASKSLPVEGLHFFTPVKGVVSEGFDSVAHPGVDIVTPPGTIVSAVFDGVVIYSGWNDELEYVVMVQHKNNLISIYGSNSKTLKRPGDDVKAGTPIALSGGVDAASGKGHLHFELWHNGHPLNPSQFISF